MDAFFNISKMGKGIEKQYLILHGWQTENKKLEEHENENYLILALVRVTFRAVISSQSPATLTKITG